MAHKFRTDPRHQTPAPVRASASVKSSQESIELKEQRDFALSPLFLAVLNDASSWNKEQSADVYYPLEINYVLDMLKRTGSEFA